MTLAVLAWCAAVLVPYLILYGHLHFNPNNPVWIALILILWAVGGGVIALLFGPARLAPSYWRPRVAVLGAWAKKHGGAEDPIPAQITFNRRVVRGRIGDTHHTIWSAHATANGFPIRLVLHGITVEYGDEDTPRPSDAAHNLPRLHYTLMIADAGVELPYLVVAAPRDDPESGLPPADTPPIEFESARFNDGWEVRCHDVATGYKVFDPRTIEMLLDLQASDLRIAWDGTSVVIAREGVDFDEAELDRWLALIDRMVHNGRLMGRAG